MSKSKVFIFGVLLPLSLVVYINGYCENTNETNFQKVHQKNLSSVSEVTKFVIDLDPILINIPGDEQNQIVSAFVSLETSDIKEITSKGTQVKDIATLILSSQEHQLLMEENFRSEVANEIRTTINSILTKDSVLKVNLDCSYNT